MEKIKDRAASMPNPLKFLHRPQTQNGFGVQAPSIISPAFTQRYRDPNCADGRLLLNQKCIYERQLPGNSYITVHISRLQKGYHDSPIVHGDRVENCRFVALNFVFHPVNTTQRFVSAKISISLQDKEAVALAEGLPLPPQIDHPNNERLSLTKVTPRKKPKFLRHAPHLLYGSLSPETLDWTFNLAGSLGVSQGPASASINPSGGVKSSYKVYKMMRIQGSVRTLNSWHGIEHDIEDGQLVWTLEENELQKSGLPREFTFVMLLTKGDAQDVMFDIDIDPVVGSWYGTYPKWWIERLWYRPMHKEDIDIDKERGQRFGPSTKEEGFNFASLMGSFDDFVTMPGTMYSRSDNPAAGTMMLDDGHGRKPANAQSTPARQLSASPAPQQIPHDLNIRVFLEGYHKNSPFNAHRRIISESAPATPQSGFVISSSRTKSHNRPRSEHFPTPPLQEADAEATARPRPVSALYDHSSASFSGETQERPISVVTDISDDLFLTPLSPIKGLRISKSLRHSRSRSDLREEEHVSQELAHLQDQSKIQHRTVELSSAHPQDGLNDPQPIRRSQSQTQAEPKVLPRYPRRLGAQPMRRTSNTNTTSNPNTHPPSQKQPQTAPLSIPSASSKKPLRPQDPNTIPPISPQKRLTPRQTRNSGYINPVDLNHARFKLAEDSPTLPLPPQPPSFPPTSFPSYAPSAALTSNPPHPIPLPPPSNQNTSTNQSARGDLQLHKTLPPAPNPPSDLLGLGVDTLVQREVSNYLKAHPELYSPQSSHSNLARPQAVLDDPSVPDSKMGADTGMDAGYQNFSMPSQVRLATERVAGHAPGHEQTARAGPSSGGGSKNGKHRRSQSAQQSGSAQRAFVNGDGRGASDEGPGHLPPAEKGRLRPQRSFERERRRDGDTEGDDASAHANANANGEFIRVSLGGVGHGGWEYLE